MFQIIKSINTKHDNQHTYTTYLQIRSISTRHSQRPAAPKKQAPGGVAHGAIQAFAHLQQAIHDLARNCRNCQPVNHMMTVNDR